ncbi:MAG: hypothetical protein ABEJ31_02770 [Haloarculaceae archaeon]
MTPAAQPDGDDDGEPEDGSEGFSVRGLVMPSPPEHGPRAPDPSTNDVPRDLARSFWKLVAIFNVALFAASLGPMLIVFRGEWGRGGAVFALGVATFVYGYWRYRRTRERLARERTGDDADQNG